MLEGYATAARHCREGGVDGIEVSMSHGYLIAQFFSPVSNRARRTRTPRRCASPARCSPPCATAPGRSSPSASGSPPTSSRPRASTPRPAPSSPATCAQAGWSTSPRSSLGHSGLLRLVELDRPAAARRARRARRPARGRPGGGRRAGDRHDAGGRRARAPSARRRRRRRRGRHDPGADRRSRARGARRRRARRTRSIACIGCNQGCIGHYHAGVPIGCVVNPRTGRERTLPRAAGRPRRDVLVIGGGPAGVAAALEARGVRRRGDAARAGRGDRRPAAARRAARPRTACSGAAGRRPRSAGSSAAGVDVRLEHGARRPRTPTRPSASSLATGARPYVPPGRAGAGGRRGGRRLDGDRQPRRRRRPGPRGRLGRRLGRARRGRGARRAGPGGHARLRRARRRLDAPAVPAQPLPRPLRRPRHPDPPPHGGRSATALRHLFSGREHRCPTSPRSS